MSNRNKQRGYELEAETADAWRKAGFEAQRVFGSGAYKHQLGDDFAADLRIEGFAVEAKRRKSGFKFIYNALDQDDADFLVIRQDRAERIYVLREKTLMEIMKNYRKLVVHCE